MNQSSLSLSFSPPPICLSVSLFLFSISLSACVAGRLDLTSTVNVKATIEQFSARAAGEIIN